jgi:hypothetical protein
MTFPKERHRPGSTANTEALAGLASWGRCRRKATKSGFHDADENPFADSRPFAVRANPIVK